MKQKFINTAKKLLSYNLFLPLADSRRFIFGFHDISNPGSEYHSPRHSTKIENFEKQIKFLKSNFNIIPLDRLVNDVELSNKRHYASIVFDDGFYSVLKNAYPVLKKENIDFSVFVNKTAILENQLWLSNLVINENNEEYLNKLYHSTTIGKIDYKEYKKDPIGNIIKYNIFEEEFVNIYKLDVSENKNYLNETDIKFLHNEGVLIGSHTKDHFNLSNCSKEELSPQIIDNKKYLENLLKTEIKHFAIPFGKKEHYNSIIIDKIFSSGHNYIYTTNIIPFKSGELKKEKKLFPRIFFLNQSKEEMMFYINRTFIRNYDL